MTDVEVIARLSKQVLVCDDLNGKAAQKIEELESELGEHKAWLAAILEACNYNGHPMDIVSKLKEMFK